MISFETNQFDILSEPKNDINPIFGHGLGELIRTNLQKKGFKTDNNVETEDWGWYFFTTSNNQKYMIGTVALVDINPETEEPIVTDDPVEFMVQFEKTRSLKEKLFNKNKMINDEPVILAVEKILKDKIIDIKNYSRED